MKHESVIDNKVLPQFTGWLLKFGYSDSNVVKRFFRISGGQFRWGTDENDSKFLSVQLNEIIGISLGRETTTFKRVSSVNGVCFPWCCFSLIFIGRTLDLCMIDAEDAIYCILALQKAASIYGASLLTEFTRSDLVRRTVMMKIRFKAEKLGKSLASHFRDTLQACLLEENHKPCNPKERPRFEYCAPKSLREKLCELRRDMQDLRASVDNLKNVPKEYRNHIIQFLDNMPSRMKDGSKIVQSLQTDLEHLKRENKALLNEIMELKGNIRVFVRVRPLLANETDDSDQPTITTRTDRISVYGSHDARARSFDFDEVFPPCSSQDDVLRSVDPFITSFLNGYNVCLFAYGVTNSGKTYTMEGDADNPGIVLAALEKVFAEAPKGVSVSLSITQIYNEVIHDLLNDATPVDIKVSPEGFQLTQIRRVELDSMSTARRHIYSAAQLRASHSTKLNAHSSRSHCIFTVSMLSLSNGAILSKLNFIDLAGSENVNRSGATGGVLKEAQAINKSLSALGDVIHSLIEAKKLNKNGAHIPFRNSKLTMMLKDSLQGESKVLMIVQVSPRQCDVIETLSSLQFGSRVRMVELGKPKRN